MFLCSTVIAYLTYSPTYLLDLLHCCHFCCRFQDQEAPSTSSSSSTSLQPGSLRTSTSRTSAPPAPASTANGSSSDSRVLRYRYMPLVAAALAELLRRTDTHLAASLQPQMRELATTLLASPTLGARSSTQQVGVLWLSKA